ncbi:MAG: hypothetical protein ACOC0P_01745, partial [Planctomycetota bacterium]
MARPPSFRISAIAELLHQLRYAPAERKRRQMEAAEALLIDVDPETTYPEDFVVWRITSYRPEIDSPALFTGTGLLADLPTFVERISRELHLTPASYPDREAVPIDVVLTELGISRSTLTRYRKLGLAVHYLHLNGDGSKPELIVFRDVLDRFIRQRPERVAKAGGFSRIDAKTKDRIIERARRYERSLGYSLNEAASRLAKKYGRSLEGVRQVLIRHDRSVGEDAIFNT